MLLLNAAQNEAHRMYKYIALEEKDVSNCQQGAWPILILTQDRDLFKNTFKIRYEGGKQKLVYELKTNHQVVGLLQTWQIRRPQVSLEGAPFSRRTAPA